MEEKTHQRTIGLWVLNYYHFSAHNFYLLPAIKLFISQRITRRSTAMLLILENPGEWGPGPGATKATSFYGNMFQHSAKGKGQMPHGCTRLAKWRSACCWPKQSSNACIPLQAAGRIGSRVDHHWHTELGGKTGVRTYSWSLQAWVVVIFIKVATEGRDGHCLPTITKYHE